MDHLIYAVRSAAKLQRATCSYFPVWKNCYQSVKLIIFNILSYHHTIVEKLLKYIGDLCDLHELKEL